MYRFLLACTVDFPSYERKRHDAELAGSLGAVRGSATTDAADQRGARRCHFSGMVVRMWSR